jgi:ribosomal-protein-alanine N-acetyltransferase
LLEGRIVNLRVVEKEDLSLLVEWFNNLKFTGRYDPVDAQQSKAEIEKKYGALGSEEKWFFIEKKDGTKVGFIGTHLFGELEIGYALIPAERGKGYCTEAVGIMVDYLFMSKDRVRVQAATNSGNKASQRVLEKSGFQKEGVVRKGLFLWGEWADVCLYGILRQEWKEPKILTKTRARSFLKGRNRS